MSARRYCRWLRVALHAGILLFSVTAVLTVGSAPAAAEAGTGGVANNITDNPAYPFVISGGKGGDGGAAGQAGSAGSAGEENSLSPGGLGGAGGAAGAAGASAGVINENVGGGGGGGGGGGSIGQVSAGSVTISTPVSAGSGGNGGNGAPVMPSPGPVAIAAGGSGGGGGEGGTALLVTGGGAVLTNTSSITGGNGGVGGNGISGGVGGNGGDGGGGIAFAVPGAVLTNSGTIRAGNGGAGGSGSAGGIYIGGAIFGQVVGDAGPAGRNGDGVRGADLTVINSGTIAGRNAINFTGGNNTLTLLPGWALTGNISVTGSVTFNQSVDVTLSNPIVGSGAVIQSGSGILTLSGSNTYSGDTTIASGSALALSGAGSIAASSGVNLTTGATFAIFGSTGPGAAIKSLAGTGGIVALGTNTLTLSNASGSFGGNIHGTGGLTLTAGTEILTGTSNNYSGATTINGGSLVGGAANAFSAASATRINSGGTLNLGGHTQTINSVLLAGGTLTNGSLSGAVTSTGGAIDGLGGSATVTTTTGTTTVSGTNTYTGATTINGGSTLALSGTGSIEASSGVNVATGGTFNISGSTAPGATIQSLAGTGGSVALGSNTLTLSNASGSFGGVINGAGGLTLTAGTETLTGTNGYTGATTINGGTLALSGTGGSIAASSGVNLAPGGTFDISSAYDPSRSFFGATIKSLAGSGGTVVLGSVFSMLTLSDASGTFGGAINGAGAVVLTTGTETLSGINGYTGPTFIEDGTLALNGIGSIAASNAVSTRGSGTFDISASAGGATIQTLVGDTGTVALGSNTLTISNAANAGPSSGTFGGAINGAGGLKLTGGTETLTGTNGYTGATTIEGGTLALSGAGSIAASSGVNLTAGAFDVSALTGPGAAIKSLAGTGGNVTLGTHTLTLSNASGTFGGAIAGSGGLTLTAGTETLAASNGYTGATTINGGTLALSGAGSIAASSGVNLAAGVFDISASTGAGATIWSLAGTGGTVTLGARTLTLANASGTFGGAITGSGGLTLMAGTETLTGNSSAFSGTVNVNSGRLLIGAGGTLGNGAATFNIHNGGTLGGTGRVGGNVAIDAGGILSAGFSPGTLTITGNLVQNIGSISNFELGQSGIVGGASNDLVNVGGNLSMAGTLNLTPPSAGWYRLYNVTGTISGSYDTVNSGALSNTIYTTIPNQVNVLLAGAGQVVQFWDGADATGNGAVNGGTATWNAGNTNWTSLPGAQINDQWRAGVGILGGVAGTVTVADPQYIQGLQFTVGGYTLTGGTLNMTGDPFSDPAKSFITTDAGVTATIDSTIAGAGIGLTKQGAGTLVLTGTNIYTGGTTINAGTLQLGNGETTGSIAGDVTNNAILAVDRSDTVTFDNVVSGTGALQQNGTGTLVLTGTNTFTGGTTINAGTLQIGNGATTGSIVGDVINNSVLAVDRSDAPVLSGAISGTGALRQNGTGTFVLTGTNTYTGGTTISAGTLQIGNGGTTGSIVGAVINNSILAINRSDALTLPGDISGTGALQQNGAGVTTLAGAASYVGATAVNAGALLANAANRFSARSAVTVAAGAVLDANGFNQTIASLAGAGTVALGAGRLTLANAASTTFSGAVAGSGGLTLAAGTQTLSGVSTYTGATAINGGTLIVTGSIAASSGVTVAAGATVGGSGRLPSMTVHGTLSPGNSPGTLTVNGNLVLGPGSLYLAEVQGAVSDRINVTGTAALAGTLRLVPLGGAYLFSASYTLLSAAGGLGSTTFGTVDATGLFGDGVTTNIGYTGTEVLLSLAPKALVPIVTPSLGVPAPRNAASVASGIDAAVARGADPSAMFAIFNLPAAAIPGALNQLSGEVHTAALSMANSAAGQFLRTMLDGSGAGRLSGQPGGPGGAAGFTADLPSRQDGPGRATFDPSRFSLWGATFGLTGRTDGDKAAGSANRNLSDGHVAVGADIRLGSNTVAGLAVASGQSRASLSGGLGKADADVFQAGLHGRTTLGSVNLAAALAYGRLETDTRRAIPALGLTGVTSSYTTQAWSGRIEASLPVIIWSDITLSPFAAFQAVRASRPAALERDGTGVTAGTLAPARRSDITSRSELGLQLDANLIAGATPVTGFVRASWAQYYQRDADLTASINGLPGASFGVTGARPDRNAALLAMGANIKLSPSVSLGMRVDSEFAANTRSIGGTAQLLVSF